ncbi:MAG: hypothetical protein WC501_04235 [Candidatus Micrarchaeia archaeon]|jgi:hypothetical protein
MLDKEKWSPGAVEIFNKVKSFGFSDTDSEVIAESLFSKKSCSWMNTDNYSESGLEKFRQFLKENDYPINISVEYIATRDKYIWNIKALK